MHLEKGPLEQRGELWNVTSEDTEKDYSFIQDLMALQLTVHSMLCPDEWTTHTRAHPHTHTCGGKGLSQHDYHQQASGQGRVIKHSHLSLLKQCTNPPTHTHAHTHRGPFNFITYVLIVPSQCTLRGHDLTHKHTPTPSLTLSSVHHTNILAPPAPFIHCLPSLNNLSWSMVLTTITL